MKHITLFSILSISFMSTGSFSMDVPNLDLFGEDLHSENAHLTSTPQSQNNNASTHSLIDFDVPDLSLWGDEESDDQGGIGG